MERDQFFTLGYISKVHGNNGRVLVKFDVDDVESYVELESVFFDLEAKLVPFFVESLQFTNQGALIKFEDLEDRDSASRYVGTSLLLPAEVLPDLGEDKYYFHELVGMQVSDQNGQEIGLIDAVYDQTSQILLGIISEGKEVLVPLVDEFVLHLDKPEKKIKLQIPDGLLDIYKNDI
jgi:16S rRNA processing protein RimM